MTDLNPWYRARQHMVDRLKADLVGSPEELSITDLPLNRYVAGILYPQEPELDSPTVEERDQGTDPEPAGLDAEDSTWDPAVSLARVRYPSSMGLTCAVYPASTPTLDVTVRAARFVGQGTGSDGDGAWGREDVRPESVTVSTRTAARTRIEVTDGLLLHAVVRTASSGAANVTLVIENTHRATHGHRDEMCWFDSSIEVRVPVGEFIERGRNPGTTTHDPEEASYALLYRDAGNLAVGHGCAVEWDATTPVTELRTTFMPMHALALSDATGGEGLTFDMRALAGGAGTEELDGLLSAYAAWIEERESGIPELDMDLQAAAHRHIDSMRTAHDRMLRGLRLLTSDEQVGHAFRLMNEAMADQRQRQDHLRRGGTGAPALQTPQRWRPFQIAFLLLNLEGLCDADSRDRDVADLLWFPTGGGKTEAYLGLIGMTILLRRLRNPTDAGVSAIMRYTLRLLTLQQFERASGLVCALEVLRRQHLPTTRPISIGLWIGGSSTPNDITTARQVLGKLQRGQQVDEENPCQLLRCPRCGSALPPAQYSVPATADRVDVRCPDRSCEFADGLPVSVVDEQVYDQRPSLVIATVDKFAMMPWKRSVAQLLRPAQDHPSPDLIVQDEFHLISGPLGTLVGLYETALDAAVAGDGPRAKLVASTATVRRAAGQMRAIFDREMHQFPPSGLDADNSFFSSSASPQDKGTRLYVGLMAPGTSPTTLLVRTYASLLQAAGSLDADEEVKDAYWTLLGYFNSLRVLGGAYMQVIDDVPDQMKVIATRTGAEVRDLEVPRELTSRKTSSEIPEELDILSTSYGQEGATDVVLATNMISVGVDVDRLGLMAVMGQPQTTSEYIQATSRVGRNRPGLVVTMYNGVRSRDLSHFENFTTYHRALYRQVEATGATPFAPVPGTGACTGSSSRSSGSSSRPPPPTGQPATSTTGSRKWKGVVI